MGTITKRDSGNWQAKVRRKGWPVQSETFQSKADAQAWIRAVEREMDVGSFIKRDDAQRTTFAEAVDRYRKEVLPSKRGAAQDSYVLTRVREEFGAYSLAAISAAMLSAYRDKRLQVMAPQTVVHELGMVGRIFKAASMDWGIALPQGNPVSLVRKPALDNGRDRRLEGPEEDLLLQALDGCRSPWPRAAVVLAIETAARQSELLSVDWREVDLRARVMRVRGKDGGVTKNGEAYRDIPLSSKAIACLEALPRSLKGRMLPISQNALQLSWERAVGRARTAHLHRLLCVALAELGLNETDQQREIRALIYKKRDPLPATTDLLEKLEKDDRVMVNLHFHDLRHEATSRLAEKLAMHELMKVTGHKTSRMLARYYHPRAADLALKLG